MIFTGAGTSLIAIPPASAAGSTLCSFDRRQPETQTAEDAATTSAANANPAATELLLVSSFLDIAHPQVVEQRVDEVGLLGGAVALGLLAQHRHDVDGLPRRLEI